MSLIVVTVLFAWNPASGLAESCTPVGPVIPGAPLPGDCFEGYDGNQIDSDGPGAGNTLSDWNSVASAEAADYAVGSNDSQFGSGGAELTPDSWTFVLGPLGSDKYDIITGWSAQEARSEADSDSFLALGYVRGTNNGLSYFAFELNQLAPGYRAAVETLSGRTIQVPTRSTGDLLITYALDPPAIGLCTWSGNEHTGVWRNFSGNAVTACPALPAELLQSARNLAPIPATGNFLMDNSVALDAKRFAEARINLTQAVQLAAGGAPQPCRDFSYLWLHSRASEFITSNQQDVILPADLVSISTCAEVIMVVCGDGIVDPPEQCDDENMNNTDACLNTCQSSTCGDGFTRTGVEQCDDANAVQTDACLTSCQNATCGDGFTRAGVEQCDDANGSNGDACLNSCQNPSCGDGFTRAGAEQCDDGNSTYLEGEYCRSDCALVPCGSPKSPFGATPLASDALFVLRVGVGQVTCDARVCDVNHSSAVTASDGLLVLRKAVGANVTLACPT